MRSLAAALMAAFLSGCAIYHARPLRASAQAALKGPSQQALVNDAHHLKVPGLRPIRLNFAAPLTGQELGVIAVLANPDLKTLRSRARVAHAQVFAAGLLPDPVVQFSALRPYGVGSIGKTTALSDGFLWDLSRLVTRETDIKIAQQHAQAIDYGVAWHEWVVANQARLDARRLYWLGLQWRMARRAETLYAHHGRLLTKDARAGLVAGPRLLAWQTTLDALRLQVASLHRAFIAARMSLNQALGLPPDARLRLAPPGPLSLPHASAPALFHRARARRLDLVALVAAYHSADYALLRTILDQYPRLSLGLAGARNSSGVSEAGLQLSLVVPLFNGNRGAIAIARAHRSALFAAYVARLARARAQIYRLRAMTVSLDREARNLRGRAQALHGMAHASASSYKAHALGLFSYLTLTQELLTVRLRLLALKLSLATTAIALQTATAEPWSRGRS